MRFFLIMYFFFTFVIISFSCIKYFLKMICIIGKSFYYMYFLYFPYIIRIHWPVLVIVNQKQIISRELPFVFLHWFSCGQKLNILMHFVFLWSCVFFLFCEYYYPIKIQFSLSNRFNKESTELGNDKIKWLVCITSFIQVVYILGVVSWLKNIHWFSVFLIHVPDT